jgi:hypothetical protein
MTPKTATEAHKLKLNAQRIRCRVKELPDYNAAMNLCDLAEADEMDAAADALLALPGLPECGMGGELAPPPGMGLIGQEDAVKCPDAVSLNASIERVTLADDCGVFNLAFDAAESINAKGAIEQMLSHQMAAAHKAAMDLLAKSSRERDTVEQGRLANTAARLMDTFQKGMLTLNRVRTGGRQLVTVQHVQVADGGQAVIAGAVTTGGQLTGGGSNK